MSDIREYIRNTAGQNNEILNRIKKIQKDIAGIVDDVESNAVAIEELAELISDEEG